MYRADIVAGKSASPSCSVPRRVTTADFRGNIGWRAFLARDFAWHSQSLDMRDRILWFLAMVHWSGSLVTASRLWLVPKVVEVPCKLARAPIPALRACVVLYLRDAIVSSSVNKLFFSV